MDEFVGLLQSDFQNMHKNQDQSCSLNCLQKMVADSQPPL